MHSDFPNSNRKNLFISSQEDTKYNCIAWALGVNNDKFWPNQKQNGYNWPSNISNHHHINSLIEFFESFGFDVCDDGKLEHKLEKIALYVENNNPYEPSHASRQLKNGYWTSKIGDSHDLRHTIEALEGGMYGSVYLYMSKPK